MRKISLTFPQSLYIILLKSSFSGTTRYLQKMLIYEHANLLLHGKLMGERAQKIFI